MKIVRSLTTYVTIFVFVVIVLFVLLMAALIIYRRKTKNSMVEEEAPADRRFHDVEGMVDVEDIADDMIIEKGRKRFVAVLRCTGGDFLRLDQSEQERVQYQYINFWLAQNERICYRQYGEDIDLSGTLDMYRKAHDEIEADLFNLIEDRKALKKRFDASQDGPDRLELAGRLRWLDRQIKAYSWRQVHLEDQIDYIGRISGPAAGRQRMIQTYVVSWTPDTGITTTAIRVITGDMVSIITTTPTRVAMDVIIIVMLWFRPVPSVSTSFVIRERTSPYGRLSKYFIGIRSIFSAISRRIR